MLRILKSGVKLVVYFCVSGTFYHFNKDGFFSIIFLN